MSPVTGFMRKQFADVGVRTRTMLSFRETWRPLRRLFPFFTGHRTLCMALFLTVVASTGISLVIAWFFQTLVGSATAHDFSVIHRMILLGMAIALFAAFVAYMQDYLRDLIVYRVARTLQVTLYSQLLRLKTGRLEQRPSGDLVSRLTRDIDAVGNGIGTSLLNIVRIPLVIGSSLVYLFTISHTLTVLSIGVIPLAILAATTFGRLARANSRQISARIGEIHAYLTESLAGHITVRTFSLEKTFSKRYDDQTQAILGLQTRNARLRSSASAIGTLTHYVAYLFSFSLGAYYVAHGHISVGSLIAFTTLMQRMVGPLMSLTGDLGNFQMAMAAADRLWDVLDDDIEGPLLEPKSLLDGKSPCDYAIRLRDVSFQYGDTPALCGVSLSVPRGRTVALVGPSGSGKSTIFKLLLGLYPANAGDLLIDDVPLTQTSAMIVRGHIAYVPQEPFLFSGTLYENISCGRLDATYSDVMAAAKQAHVHSFVSSLPNGYETRIGEHGVGLSGGQRQRIAIARALVKNAPILLLDEATSALDSESEAIVAESLESLMEHRSTLIIAHRFATVQRADYVYVLDEGRIVEQGLPNQLLRRGGRFARMNEAQNTVLYNEYKLT